VGGFLPVRQDIVRFEIQKHGDIFGCVVIKLILKPWGEIGSFERLRDEVLVICSWWARIVLCMATVEFKGL